MDGLQMLRSCIGYTDSKCRTGTSAILPLVLGGVYATSVMLPVLVILK